MGIENDFFSPPLPEEVEITLIGTGGGYGESVVVKLNRDEWAIIDSCINPNTGKALPLEYLEKLGIDYKTQVKFVICTHWHNDHILGISEILEKCEQAQFCMPDVHDRDKFLLLVNIDSKKDKIGSVSSYNIFKDCLDIIGRRKIIPKRMKRDLVFHNETFIVDGKEISSTLFSLSPSDSVIQKFDFEISTLLDGFELSKKSVVHKSANEKSSVIIFQYDEFTALLGADLEVTENPDEGWKDICNNSVLIKGKSIIYKIPHHGSSNGYDNEVYEKLIDNNAILKLSPWNRKTKLPTDEMLKKYLTHSDKLYITSAISLLNKPKKRDKTEEKLINLFARKLSEVKFNEGIVRTRHELSGEKNIKVETHGSAFHVNEL